jgi:hypothetical protein
MSTLDRLESSFLFRLTRLLSLLVVVVAGILIVVAGFAFLKIAVPVATSVSSAEVREVMKSQPEPSLTERPLSLDRDATAVNAEVDQLLAELPRTEIDLPMMRAQIKRWLDELPDAGTRLQFVREMRGAIRSIADEDKARACFAFAQAKGEKLAQEYRRKESLKENRASILTTVAAGLFLIAISSLVLVLLRIERNTRPSERP